MAAFRSLVPSMFGKNWWDTFKFPSRILDQTFGVLVLDSDLQDPRFSSGKFIVPRTKAVMASSGFSEVTTTETEFRIRLDTSPFHPDEIQVRMVGKFVVVRGQHGPRATDGEGTVAREFTRRYMLPEGCDAAGVGASWDPEGALVVTAPRNVERLPRDREIPIQGPEPVEEGAQKTNGYPFKVAAISVQAIEKPVAKPAVKSVSEAAKPVQAAEKPPVKPVQYAAKLAHATEKPAVKPVSEAAKHGQAAVKPVPEAAKPAQAVEKPAVKPVLYAAQLGLAQAIEKLAVKPVSEAAKPAQAAEKPAVKPVPEAAKPAVKPVSESAQAAEKPAVKPVSESAQAAEKPAVKPVPEAANPAQVTEKPIVKPVHYAAKLAQMTEKPSVKPVPEAAKLSQTTEKPVPKAAKPATEAENPATKEPKKNDPKTNGA